MGSRELPRPEDLQEYKHAVAGHAGTMCDADGQLFVKPCTQTEIEFYDSAVQRHPEFAELMPFYLGSLILSDPVNGNIDEAVSRVMSETGAAETTKAQIVASVTEQIANLADETETKDRATWIPSKGKKINTDKAVVLENASHGFKRPNILDVKLGVRLWADDAPEEKKRRFDQITEETTHKTHGFRIAGMRVFRGSEDSSELDDEEYKIYDKDYGRISVNKDNVMDEFRRFIFNKAAGIDENLGRAVCAAFARDLTKIHDVMSNHESRMYSPSLLFTFEGDGKALQSAIEENNSLVDKEISRRSSNPATKRIDSGIGLDEESSEEDGSEEDGSEESEAPMPLTHSLKLIDFAHAQWTPNQGHDKNILTGIESLKCIFEKWAKLD